MNSAPSARPASGIGNATAELSESVGILHQAISELETLLENVGVLQPAPPSSVAPAGIEKAQRYLVSESVRTSSESVLAARNRILTLRDRVDA